MSCLITNIRKKMAAISYKAKISSMNLSSFLDSEEEE